MIIYPAIDLKNGQVVRLKGGDMNKTTVFSNNPSKQAVIFERDGAEWLHVVDLDGAIIGQGQNIEAIRDIISQTSLKIQLGGGIRSIDDIEKWIELGVSRVILGTLLVKDPGVVLKACAIYPHYIALALDIKDGFVATDGWVNTSRISVNDILIQFKDSKVSSLIYTDIKRDGLLTGPNISEIKKIVEKSSFEIIASGGVSSFEDLKNVYETGAQGIICGRSLYDRKIDLKQAIKYFQKDTH
tara:strand:+ start:210 stop:935 length:726 start_codon:yes stop_codon:yes gene_type:complete